MILIPRVLLKSMDSPFLKVSADDGIDGATVKTRPTEMMNVMMAR